MYLGDSPLHNQEVRIVHIQLNCLEKVLDILLLNVTAVYQVSVATTDYDLPTNLNLINALITKWTSTRKFL
jgi:hypothetical protein